MGWAALVAAILIAAMTGFAGNILANGSLDQGLGMDRFIAGLADPWQTFIGFDLMGGLLLATSWIVWRERGARWLDTVAWALCILWWGNVVVAIYMIIALLQSGGDPARFFMGARAGQLRPVWTALGLAFRCMALVAGLAIAGFTVAKVQQLGLASLSGQAYLPGFGPVILAMILLAFPGRPRTAA